MSQGKYSPALTFEMCKRPYSDYRYNADKQIPPERKNDFDYETRIHFDCYDEDGFDSYGYSGFDMHGNYVGAGMGVDRWGYTEMDYLEMSSDMFEDICRYGV